ncbi:MAG TPA: hypothetical protein VHM88_00590 [Candidatus Acidoferrales bacterium]|jgi:hypothetical protein|nr:hypothetical protein [Candidatus Acidoferrales bacterium]
MPSWLAFFVVVTAVAVVLQMGILLGLYLQFRRMNEHTTRIATDLHARITPILTRLQVTMEDAQPRITSMLSDAAEITHLARAQAQKVDRVFTEGADRLRIQLIRADRIVTGALEAIEESGSKLRRTLWGPVHEASAFIKGVKTGLDFFRSRRRPDDQGSESQQDEGLFI